MTPAEKFSTPFTTEAAKSEPGRRGTEGLPDLEGEAEAGLETALLLYPGS
jgi:hypothetical protein